MSKPEATRTPNFLCNDCKRGFSKESAWQYHGENTGHNINGDLPSPEAERLRVQLAADFQTRKIFMKEVETLRKKLAAIRAVLDV